MKQDILNKFFEWFDTYTNTFMALGNEHIQQNVQLKIDHSQRVSKYCSEIATELNLSASNIRLATAAGLLHDVGRFEQIKKYQTFDDFKSENHALLGMSIVAHEKILHILTNEEREIIMNCIGHHNAIHIPETCDEDSLLFLKILRDADKIDIFFILKEYYKTCRVSPNNAIDLEYEESGSYESYFINTILSGKNCDYRHAKSAEDIRLMRLSWLFDLQYSYSIVKTKEMQYVETIIESLPQTKDIKKVEQYLTNYLSRKIDQNSSN